MKKNQSGLFIAGMLAVFLIFPAHFSCTSKSKNNIPKDYQGKVFQDEKYKAGPQLIPGKVECKYFDLGGEGIAYHDKDTINRGSGKYNYQDGHCEGVADYVCHFREEEGVDLSFTKDFLDFDHPNPFEPELGQGFIGWTRDGEWCNYTVEVSEAGIYQVGILYSNDPVPFRLLVNGELAGEYKLPRKTDNYHTWDYGKDLGAITFEKAGLNLLTLEYSGGANYAYLEFYQ